MLSRRAFLIGTSALVVAPALPAIAAPVPALAMDSLIQPEFAQTQIEALSFDARQTALRRFHPRTVERHDFSDRYRAGGSVSGRCTIFRHAGRRPAHNAGCCIRRCRRPCLHLFPNGPVREIIRNTESADIALGRPIAGPTGHLLHCDTLRHVGSEPFSIKVAMPCQTSAIDSPDNLGNAVPASKTVVGRRRPPPARCTGDVCHSNVSLWSMHMGMKAWSGVSLAAPSRLNCTKIVTRCQGAPLVPEAFHAKRTGGEV